MPIELSHRRLSMDTSSCKQHGSNMILAHDLTYSYYVNDFLAPIDGIHANVGHPLDVFLLRWHFMSYLKPAHQPGQCSYDQREFTRELAPIFTLAFVNLLP
ncbi:unnamed protein product [Polarella glacialis]|uniref:Uncharacterized protein n=1 Tax=Polarella glacialis TaxID=89957 RepID=A0A813DK09_POLGL|nr:unnamed protein product [Polarella glacialis]